MYTHTFTCSASCTLTVKINYPQRTLIAATQLPKLRTISFYVRVYLPSSNDSEFDSDGALLAFLVNILEIRL